MSCAIVVLIGWSGIFNLFIACFPMFKFISNCISFRDMLGCQYPFSSPVVSKFPRKNIYHF